MVGNGARPGHRAVPLGQTLARALPLVLVMLTAVAPARSWGEKAHEMVNAAAIENLPEPLRTYFRAQRAYLVTHAGDPDHPAHATTLDRLHHFTDAEAYDRYPFGALRTQFVEESRPPTAAELKEGDSIWQIERYTLELERDWRARRSAAALRAAIFAAHYAADLTQPLHTVVNYDGQKTGQAGIHARFETELVKALGDGWQLRPPPAEYAPRVRARIFSELLESYRSAPLIFAADRNAATGRSTTDPRYFYIFAQQAGPLARRRLQAAAGFVSSLWYTAWVRAGKPDLRHF